MVWKAIAGAILALSPVSSYGDTIWSMYKSKSCTGFSIDITAIMLISSMIRIFFYFGNPFETSLLIQSIINIIVQVTLLSLSLQYRVLPPPTTGSTSRGSILDKNPDDEMIHLSHKRSRSDMVYNVKPSTSRLDSVKEEDDEDKWRPNRFYQPKNTPIMKKIATFFQVQVVNRFQDTTRHFKSFNRMLQSGSHSSYSTRPFGFWQWDDATYYWKFLGQFFLVLCVLHLFLGTWSHTYVHSLGMIGLSLEAILPLPQLITNARRHSVQGFRVSVLLNWIVGDLSKIMYFLFGTSDPKKLAPQFVICSLIQTSLDMSIGVQYYYYTYLYKTPGSTTTTSSSINTGTRIRSSSISTGVYPTIPQLSPVVSRTSDSIEMSTISRRMSIEGNLNDINIQKEKQEEEEENQPQGVNVPIPSLDADIIPLSSTSGSQKTPEIIGTNTFPSPVLASNLMFAPVAPDQITGGKTQARQRSQSITKSTNYSSLQEVD